MDLAKIGAEKQIQSANSAVLEKKEVEQKEGVKAQLVEAAAEQSDAARKSIAVA